MGGMGFFFHEGKVVWEGGEFLPQNSYKPSVDAIKFSLQWRTILVQW